MTSARRQTLLELAVAVAVAWGLVAVVEADDPFRGTLGVLPFVVAALRAVERHAGARVLARHEGRLAAVVLGGLVLVTLGRQRLGLVATDWFLAAGFLLLLAHRAARLTLGLRPLLGRRLPRRPAPAFFLVPFIAYLAIQPWSSRHRQPDGDEPYYLLVAHSLAHDLDVDLADNYGSDWQHFMSREIEPQIGDPTGPEGQLYSRHGFLLPLVLAPAYRLAGRAGAMAVMAAISAALAWMVLRLASHYAPREPAAALLAYGLMAASPPLLLYSYQIWVEVPAALLLTVALDRLLVLRRERWTPRRTASFALALVLLPLLKLRLGLLAAALLVLAGWRARPGRKAASAWVGVLAAGVVVLLAFNTLRFGNALRIYSWGELDLFQYPAFDFVRGGVGMFYDGAFGLFPSAPIWMLLLPAVGLLARRRDPLLADLMVVSLPYLVFVAPRVEWFGGWSPPFRYPLAVLPLLALSLIPVLARRRQPVLRALLAALGALTLVLAVIWVVIPGWTYNFADGRSHLLDEAGVRLGADVARFFPSTIRPRPATWLWLAGSLLAIPFGAWLGRPGGVIGRAGRRSAPLWGVAALLLMLPLWVLASRALPTRVVHLEDAFVGKRLGTVHPPSWVLQRPIYVGGWALPAGGQLTAPVVAGGAEVEIEIAGKTLADVGAGGAGRLWIGAGETRLATWEATREWSSQVLGPFAWPAGEPLVIRGGEASAPVIVDRVELRWR